MEMVNFIQAGYIASDRSMYDPGTDTPATARTSNLCEDLGQVRAMHASTSPSFALMIAVACVGVAFTAVRS